MQKLAQSCAKSVVSSDEDDANGGRNITSGQTTGLESDRPLPRSRDSYRTALGAGTWPSNSSASRPSLAKCPRAPRRTRQVALWVSRESGFRLSVGGGPRARVIGAAFRVLQRRRQSDRIDRRHTCARTSASTDRRSASRNSRTFMDHLAQLPTRRKTRR